MIKQKSGKMKKIIPVTLILCLLVTASVAQFSKKGDKEKKFIETFLSYMKNQTDYEGMMKSISPNYLSQNGIDTKNYKVDNYFIADFSIEKYDKKTGMVTAKIWGVNRTWVHRLIFKLCKEKGNLYIVPSKHNDNYIIPWWEKETYIKE